MNIVEFMHDQDHPKKSNIDIWVGDSEGYATKKILVYENRELPDYDSYDLILLHGGAQHLWDKDADPWLYKEVEYIKNALKRNKPVIGFCLGSQILADALGSKVYQSSEKEIGWFNITPRPQDVRNVLLDGLEEGFETFLWHSDHYHLPDRCQSLAYTGAAEHQLFASLEYPAVGYQFHPEYTKETIKYYCKTYYDQAWKGGINVLGKDIFLKELDNRPETYPLFKNIILNALKWFSTRFDIPGDYSSINRTEW